LRQKVVEKRAALLGNRENWRAIVVLWVWHSGQKLLFIGECFGSKLGILRHFYLGANSINYCNGDIEVGVLLYMIGLKCCANTIFVHVHH